MAAVRQNGKALVFAHESLKRDKEAGGRFVEVLGLKCCSKQLFWKDFDMIFRDFPRIFMDFQGFSSVLRLLKDFF